MAAFQSDNLRVEQRPEGIAFLRLDVPGRSVNVFTRQVLADLDAALKQIAADPAVRVLVLRSDKVSGFIAGADLHEFARIQTPAEAQAISATGQKVFGKLADLRIPSIALIHGPCLGGGLELALACDYRLALDHAKTQFGLPEVELGLLPGWGGTQRLPRVVGVERTLQVILAGRRLNARDALRWGLADMLGTTEQELSSRLSLLILRAAKDGKRPKKGLPLRTWRQRLLESTPVGRFLVFRGAERLLHRRVPEDMPAPWEALRAVRVGLSKGLEAGLAFEREAAGRLASGPACRNLINLFLKGEEARKLPEKLAGGSLPEVRRVAVVGAGTMGAGIAQLAAIRGFDVTIREVNETALAAGQAKLADLFQKAVHNRILTEEAARQKLAAVRCTTGWDGFGEADLVVEAVLEDVALKRQVFDDLERHARPEAILATNTSSLLVRKMQEGRPHPERVAGLHFFNPVHKMPLIEVVRTPATSDQAVALLVRWAVALGKVPVVVLDSPGFIVNRILMPYLAEAVLLAAQGVPVNLLDQTMRRFGMPMGPLELLDQVGLDVAAQVARALQPLFAQRAGNSPVLVQLADTFEAMRQRGWLGQKAGLGFYRYRGKAKKVHREALALLPADARREGGALLGGLPKAVQMREARERMVLLMVNEAAACLGEGVAADAASMDLAMVLGTGWAPHRGGPLRYGADRGYEQVVQRLEELAGRLRPRFEPGTALRQLATKAVAREGA